MQLKEWGPALRAWLNVDGDKTEDSHNKLNPKSSHDKTDEAVENLDIKMSSFVKKFAYGSI